MKQSLKKMGLFALFASGLAMGDALPQFFCVRVSFDSNHSLFQSENFGFHFEKPLPEIPNASIGRANEGSEPNSPWTIITSQRQEDSHRILWAFRGNKIWDASPAGVGETAPVVGEITETKPLSKNQIATGWIKFTDSENIAQTYSVECVDQGN